MKNEEIINFYSENDFELQNSSQIGHWITSVITSEGKRTGELNFIFCDDPYLLDMNQKYLNHDTYTDIISFDNSIGNILNGDIFISTERVQENAETYMVSFEEELRRVVIHGVLHLCGYKDASPEEKSVMRKKEEEKLEMFHVEQ